MDSHLANLLRRSRQPHQRAAAVNLKNSMGKRAMDLDQLSAIQEANSRAAAGTATSARAAVATTANPATPVTAATVAVGGVASRIQSSPSPASSAVAPSSVAPAPVSSAAPATSNAVRSSVVSSSIRPSTSSSTIRSTSSVAPSSSSTRAPASIVTSTRALSSSSTSSLPSSSTLPIASVAAASQSSESTGLGTGPIVGIAIAVLVGLVILGSCVGWVYRKHAQRKYSDKAPWAKLDDQVTPFPHDNEKPTYLSPDDDIYGHSQAPVIGSRRALALARQNGFNADGSMRPDSDYMVQRGDNNAGYGANRGLGNQYGAYPAMDPGYDYGYDQGAPSPAYDYGQDQTGMAVSAPGNTRQLVGPNGAPHGFPMPAPLAPVAMGRPAPPQSAAEFADREEFMDLPKPTPTNSSGNHMSQYSTYGLAYAESEPDYMPHTATTTGWAGDAKAPQHTPLPTIEPASPLMSSFDFQKRQSLGPIASNFASKYGSSTLPNYQDEDENSRQKRMYGEVATAAGVQEPTTPHTADLSHSTNSYETASSFSAHQQSEPRSISHRLPPAPMPALPTVNVLPPQPYQHGRPLSPLTEVETPRSIALTSSSVMHGQELNPFEHALHPPNPQSSALRPPFSATSSTGATAFPSPNFPPPSPGGMSVPGSVTDSPRKRESMFDVDDAYGGI